ncbi:sensor histidine kinase [Sphingosinicella terrae]|uniref:sensor histidine kinase n=1 Tax=Sphingosinicella terrae TaxID=2172047 RepID=UPI000E0CC98F|nr:ATP-binding protein [Sphingosinicella terrae]
MRLLGSFSFRLALLYAALFTLSVAILLGLYYWVSIRHPTNEVQAGLEGEAARLERLYRVGGEGALAAALERRAAAMAPRVAYHALIANDGRVIAANLPSWPAPSGARWLRIEADVYRDGDEDDHEALVLDRPLPGGARLLVGRDIEDLDEIEEAVRGAAVWLLPALLVLVFVGAALMSRAIGRRLDTLGNAARRVMDGDLTGRVPVRGPRDDFDRLGATLNAMLDRIEASMESVRRVSDSVAHELRTPLSRLQADLAELRSASPHRAAELRERALAESDRLARMFDAVLRIARIEAQRHAVELAPVDLGALLVDAADYHAPLAEDRGIALETKVTDDLTVSGDRDLLFQAVSNLIDNAIKFTPEGGAVSLDARREADAVVVTLTDTGPGIPPDLLGRLGERFFRAPEAAGIAGFGLGLALVRAVARLHASPLDFTNGKPGLVVRWRLGWTKPTAGRAGQAPTG